MAKVKIQKAFETVSHNVSDDLVGKEIDVAREVAAEWVNAGYATPADDATAQDIAAPPTDDEPAAASTSPGETPEQNVVAISTPEGKSLGRMKKLELLQLAAKRNLPASESMSVKELIALIEGGE